MESDGATLKQVEAQLAKMTKVFVDGADPILIFDLDRSVLDMNFETERVFGWSRAELVGGPTRHLLPPELHPLADSVWERLGRGETVRNYETAVRTKSGEVVPVLTTSFLLTSETGQPVAAAAIIKDITQLKRTTEQLQQRNRELQQFANVLAHDLGAPLRGIKGSAQLLDRHCKDQLDEQAGEYLEMIQDSVHRMQRLIKDLLDFARVEHQAKTFQAVDCSQVFEHAVKNLHAAIEENDAKVTCDTLPTIHGNATQLVQLFQNLIGNAIKFRRADAPRVHVTTQRSDEGWHFQVRDNGIGIEATHLDKIFDVFQRLHSEAEFPGTGIGLAICKAIVERHGGRIWIESEKGKGSIFHFTIPVRPPDQP
jgi:PAS domain S-box-containing protein